MWVECSFECLYQSKVACFVVGMGLGELHLRHGWLLVRMAFGRLLVWHVC
jgi:hypothetical protein